MKTVPPKSLFAKSMCSFYCAYLEFHKSAAIDDQTQFYIRKFGLSANSSADNENRELKACIFFVFLRLEYIDFSINKVAKCIELKQFEKAHRKGLHLFRMIKLIVAALNKIDQIVKMRNSLTFDWLNVELFEELTMKNLEEVWLNTRDIVRQELIKKDLVYIRDKMNLCKFMLPLYLIMNSSFYGQKTKKYARITLDDFRNMLQDTTLQYLKLQTKKLTGVKSKRNSDNGTTRILGVFTRKNEDIYLFRLDFPHKNEESIHINVHETKNGNIVAAGYPLKKDEIQTFSLTQQEIDELFVYDGKYYWFKLRSQQKISELRRSQQIKDSLMTRFRSQSHFIILSSCKEREYYSFVEEYKRMLEFMQLPFAKSESFDKEDAENVDIIYEIRDSLISKNLYGACLLNRVGVEISKISSLTGLPDDVVVDLLNKTKGLY